MTICTLAWHCTTQTSMTTCMLAWLRTMRTPLNTSTERHAQFSDSHLDLIHTIGSRFESRLSYHPHGHQRACGLLALTFSFYFPFFLPSLFFFLLLFLTNKMFINLYNSAKEGVDTNDVLSFTTIRKVVRMKLEKSYTKKYTRHLGLLNLLETRMEKKIGFRTRSPCRNWAAI